MGRYRYPTVYWQEPYARNFGQGKKQSFRFRKILCEGVEVRALTTRYSYATGKFIREDGPRGGKRVHEFPRNAYYYNGRFWKIARTTTKQATREEYLDPDGWYAYLEPLTGLIYDVYTRQSEAEGVPVVSITVEDGYPVSVEGDLPWDQSQGDFHACMAPWLKLDRKPRKRTDRKKKAA